MANLISDQSVVAIEIFSAILFHSLHYSITSESLTWRTKAAARNSNPNSSAQNRGGITWPRSEQIAIVEGDIMLGGLMMVHERDEQVICGKIMPQGGLQATEAMLYTLDRINALNIIPGVTLGARIKDDCDRDVYGLEQSVDFIRGSVQEFAGTTEDCLGQGKPEMIAGVVGAPSSVTSIQVANLLKLFKIPQISFFSTSPSLSSVERFPYFLRTIPSDIHQAEAMVELVQLFKWTYVSIVYEESSYGQMGYEAVRDLLLERDICIAVIDKLKKDSGVATSAEYDKTVRNLLRKPSARGVIVFASDQEVGELMKAIERANKSGYFTWIGSDGWGGRTLVSDGNELQVEGAVTVQPYAEPIKGFYEYFLNLVPANNTRNPWFLEYWEDYFRCRIPGSAHTPFNQNYTKSCDDAMRQTWKNGFEPEAQLQFVSDAVMAFAHALREMHLDLCGGESNPGLCEAMDPYDGKQLLEYLLKANFTGLSASEFRFLSNGDSVPRYRILNFKQNVSGVFSWQTVGVYENQELKMNMEQLKFTLNSRQHPSSVCSEECGARQAKVISDTTQQCCWKCMTCDEYEYLPTPFKCEPCDLGMRPNALLTQCVPIPVEYLRYNSPIAIVAIIFALSGVCSTLYVLHIFVKHRETPVVRASGRELSFVLLIGILLCFAMTFIIIAPPTNITCAAEKFGIGFCFTVCYAAVLTKTNRISRIFRAGKRTVKRPKCISPQSQLVICGSMVLFYGAIAGVWMTMSPPKAGHHYPSRSENQRVCLSAVGLSYMIGFAYPIFLIIVCTFYACLTRNIPEAFNESRHIGFTMYTTCIIWLAFVPIYFSTANNIEIRLATLCFSVSLSATVALICMFTPKLYIILFHPEKNVRQSMLSAKIARHEKSPMNTMQTKLPTYARVNGEIELHRRKGSCTSISSLNSKLTSATQTHDVTASSISTQTCNGVAAVDHLQDVFL